MKPKIKTSAIEPSNKLNITRRTAHMLLAAVLLCACGSALTAQLRAAPATQGSRKGAAGQMPAYYDGKLLTVNMFEVPASDPIIENDPTFNVIFASNDLDDEQDFAPVIDAIQGDGFNPLWLQVLIVFNPGFTPHQFFSDDEVEDAARGANPEITLVVTDEIYRCSVVGRK